MAKIRLSFYFPPFLEETGNALDTEYVSYLAELDSCYTLKTDLPVQVADKELIHDRYKDLAMVETAFRTCKTSQLEVRPVFVRTEANTRGPILVVMLAYRITRALKQAWKDIDLTVEEGLRELDRICAMQLSAKAAVLVCGYRSFRRLLKNFLGL